MPVRVANTITAPHQSTRVITFLERIQRRIINAIERRRLIGLVHIALETHQSPSLLSALEIRRHTSFVYAPDSGARLASLATFAVIATRAAFLASMPTLLPRSWYNIT